MDNLNSFCDFSRDVLHWSFSTLGCAEMDLDGIVELAARFGIESVELRALRGTADITDCLRQYGRNYPERFKHLAETSFVNMLDSSFCLVSENDSDYDKLLDLAAMADKLQVPYCRVFGGFDYSENPAPGLIRCARNGMSRWYSLKQDCGIQCQLALETHDGFSSATNCQLLFDALGHPVPIVWDVHHTWRFGGEPMQESLESLNDKIVQIHVKDSIKAGSGKPKGALPSEGDVPVKEILDILRVMRFEKPVSLEWERLWEPELPPLENALKTMYSSWFAATDCF